MATLYKKSLIYSGLALAVLLLIFYTAGYLLHPPVWEIRGFLYLNQMPWPTWVDRWAILMRNPLTWVPLYLLLLIVLFRSSVPRRLNLVGVLLLSVVLSDQASASIIKPLVGRDRPCRHAATAELCQTRVHCGSGFGFVSSHAANHFALAWALGLGLPARWRKMVIVPGLLWAGLIALAQVRVGVHFPGDILVGAVLGLFCASFALLFRKELEPTH
jgi:undecaprenyl-diphosphatase